MRTKLPRGHFCGTLSSSREVGEFTLTEYLYPPGLNISSHCHEQAYFSVELARPWLERVGDLCPVLDEPALFHGGRLASPLLEMSREVSAADETSRLVVEGLSGELGRKLDDYLTRLTDDGGDALFQVQHERVRLRLVGAEDAARDARPARRRLHRLRRAGRVVRGRKRPDDRRLQRPPRLVPDRHQSLARHPENRLRREVRRAPAFRAAVTPMQAGSPNRFVAWNIMNWDKPETVRVSLSMKGGKVAGLVLQRDGRQWSARKIENQ